MKSKCLSLLIISIFVFSSISFCQRNKKDSDSTDEKTSLSFLYGYFVGVESHDNVWPIFGLSLNTPIGKKFFIVPEFFLISWKKHNTIIHLYSFQFRYKIINSKTFDLNIQSGLGLLLSREGFGILYQIGLTPEITIDDIVKIGFDFRLQPVLGSGGPFKFYALSIGINY